VAAPSMARDYPTAAPGQQQIENCIWRVRAYLALCGWADFGGKYVLLDFWMTWCGPCCAETPNLKGVHDAYGKDPKFAMLGLSLDKAVEAPKD
jgi:thiol-disulfide isomerase/thioredoxin